MSEVLSFPIDTQQEMYLFKIFIHLKDTNNNESFIVGNLISYVKCSSKCMFKILHNEEKVITY